MPTYTYDQIFSLQRRGYYRTEIEEGETLRTLLVDILEDAPKLSMRKLSPVVRYFEKILESIKSSKLQSFTLFPKLPFEVRNMIWTYALPGQRIIKLSHHP